MYTVTTAKPNMKKLIDKLCLKVLLRNKNKNHYVVVPPYRYGKSIQTYEYARTMALKGGEVTIAHPEGNCVLMSEEKYNTLREKATGVYKEGGVTIGSTT